MPKTILTNIQAIIEVPIFAGCSMEYVTFLTGYKKRLKMVVKLYLITALGFCTCQKRKKRNLENLLVLVYCISVVIIHVFSLDGAFRQQRLPAWQPVLIPRNVLPTFFIVGILFTPIGGLLYWSNDHVRMLCVYSLMVPLSNELYRLTKS